MGKDWSYDDLMRGISFLESCKDKLKDDPLAIQSAVEWDCRSINHTIEFIEWNIEQGEILSPLQTYLTQK
jgi:hypothetical protein